MDKSDELKADLKRLSSRAIQSKMDLHDLSGELPVGWEEILELVRLAYDAFDALTRKREENHLASAELVFYKRSAS